MVAVVAVVLLFSTLGLEMVDDAFDASGDAGSGNCESQGCRTDRSYIAEAWELLFDGATVIEVGKKRAATERLLFDGCDDSLTHEGMMHCCCQLVLRKCEAKV